ncbi:MAG TPA: thiazole synthase, partial [Acidimicrobiales bacterium]|nr:thiazole synthase [Acidimicrobiales bacterium]
MEELLTVGSFESASRLVFGTGGFRSLEVLEATLEAARVKIATVALRRVDPTVEGSLYDVLERNKVALLPNTAGCYTADEAVRTCRLARELLDDHRLVKLEVIGDKGSLFPDMVETIRAAEQLVAEGFEVMVYTTDDPVAAKRLEAIG